MGYDYGEGALPRGRARFADQRDHLTDEEISRQGYQAEPSAGRRTPGQHPASRGDVGRRTGAGRGGEFGTANQSGKASTYRPPGDYGGPIKEDYSLSEYATAPYGGKSVQNGAGPRRRQDQNRGVRYQPQATRHVPGWPDVEPEAGRPSRKPILFAIIALVLLISGGAGWYYLRGSANRPLTEGERRVADRAFDPVQLTASEVFGSRTIPGAPGNGPYKVLKTQAATDCKTAAGGAVATILATAGCTQVVRATLMSSDGSLVITAGIFNLPTQTSAGKAAAAIKTAVDEQKGRFSGLVAGGATNAIGRAAANLAWNVRGHYLAYCLIANADGSAIAADDSRTQAVRNDLVENYLGDVVIHRRETGPTASATPRS